MTLGALLVLQVVSAPVATDAPVPGPVTWSPWLGAPKLATIGTQHFAAWTESTHYAYSVVATRIDATGAVLDDLNILVDAPTAPLSPQVTHDGLNWIVVTSGVPDLPVEVHRVDPATGAVLDPTPITVA